MQSPDLTALRLDEARAALSSDARFSTCAVTVIETAPPSRAGTYTQKSTTANRRTFQMCFGDWRVLRCRLKPNEIELTVAREELRDDSTSGDQTP